MKFIRTFIKKIAFILSLLLLFQGCTVYQKAAITLEEAYQANDKVRVETKIGEKFKFNYIDFEEGVFYGVKDKYGEITKLPLDSNYIERIKLKDKTGSILASILIPPILVIGIPSLIFLLATGGDGLSW